MILITILHFFVVSFDGEMGFFYWSFFILDSHLSVERSVLNSMGLSYTSYDELRGENLAIREVSEFGEIEDYLNQKMLHALLREGSVDDSFAEEISPIANDYQVLDKMLQRGFSSAGDFRTDGYVLIVLRPQNEMFTSRKRYYVGVKLCSLARNLLEIQSKTNELSVDWKLSSNRIIFSRSNQAENRIHWVGGFLSTLFSVDQVLSVKAFHWMELYQEPVQKLVDRKKVFIIIFDNNWMVNGMLCFEKTVGYIRNSQGNREFRINFGTTDSFKYGLVRCARIGHFGFSFREDEMKHDTYVFMLVNYVLSPDGFRNVRVADYKRRSSTSWMEICKALNYIFSVGMWLLDWAKGYFLSCVPNEKERAADLCYANRFNRYAVTDCFTPERVLILSLSYSVIEEEAIEVSPRWWLQIKLGLLHLSIERTKWDLMGLYVAPIRCGCNVFISVIPDGTRCCNWWFVKHMQGVRIKNIYIQSRELITGFKDLGLMVLIKPNFRLLDLYGIYIFCEHFRRNFSFENLCSSCCFVVDSLDGLKENNGSGRPVRFAFSDGDNNVEVSAFLSRVQTWSAPQYGVDSLLKFYHDVGLLLEYSTDVAVEDRLSPSDGYRNAEAREIHGKYDAYLGYWPDKVFVKLLVRFECGNSLWSEANFVVPVTKCRLGGPTGLWILEQGCIMQSTAVVLSIQIATYVEVVSELSTDINHVMGI